MQHKPIRAKSSNWCTCNGSTHMRGAPVCDYDNNGRQKPALRKHGAMVYREALKEMSVDQKSLAAGKDE